VVWCGVGWCGFLFVLEVVWCGVVWGGVVWCGVVWGEAQYLVCSVTYQVSAVEFVV